MGALALDHLSAPQSALAKAPASRTSASAGGTSAHSNAIPTVVTQSPPPGSAPVNGEGARSESVAAVVATPTSSAQPAPVLTDASVPPVPQLNSGVVQPSEPVVSPTKAQALLDLMNASRTREKLSPLERDAALDEVALVRARSLVTNGYFDHYSPDGESAFSELAVRGIRYRLAGENLARNNYPEARTVSAAFEGLMASPGHRANILEERFSSVGVVAVQSGRMWIYVMVFTN